MNGDQERLKYEGRLAVLDRQIAEVRLKLTGLRDSLRGLLDPFDPAESLDGEQIASQAVEFARIQTELVELVRQAAAIKRALGR